MYVVYTYIRKRKVLNIINITGSGNKNYNLLNSYTVLMSYKSVGNIISYVLKRRRRAKMLRGCYHLGNLENKKNNTKCNINVRGFVPIGKK